MATYCMVFFPDREIRPSTELLQKILDNQPHAQDLLNAGHTEWALQNIKGALSFYQQAVQMENGNILKFQEQFSQDVADLLIAGIEEAEVALMLDQLRYKIEGAI